MKYLVVLCVLLISQIAHSQEVNCDIAINSDQIGNVDRSLFDDMKTAIYDFVNTKRWTPDKFKPHEKIECSILINLTSASGNVYEGSIQISSRRPVYGTSYSSTIWNFKDDNVVFDFDRNAVLEYSESTFLSNLTALLGYYTYMIIAYDYETYSLNGGTPYFTKAQNIVAMAQSSGYKGWSSTDKRNRYWLVEDHLSPRFTGLRKCYYEYHRLGLDYMKDDVVEGRKKIAGALGNLAEVHSNYPASFNMRVFFDSKASEVIKIFKEGTREEKTEITSLLNKIDPANIIKYQEISQ
ncbi:MAG: DUF4835 family protein [Salibacteraceae bacterium]